MATKSELRRRRAAAAENARKPGGSDGSSSAESTGERRREKKRVLVPSSPSANESDPNSKLRRRASGGLSVGITPFDVFICIVLLAAAAAVRLHNLAGIQSVVFDEVHYLKFIRWTIKGEYFFDVNPVFGKLALAALARLLNFDEQLQDFDAPGEPLPSAQVAFAARAPAAIFGALTVPVFYRVCRLLRLSPWAAVVGASFILLDSMHVIQSRIAMVDSVLVFLTCASLLFALMLWNAKNVATLKRSAVTFPDIARIVIGLVLTGGASGLAVSTRWTAFATPVLISVISLFGVPPFCYEPLNLLECTVLFASMLGSYFFSFAIFLLHARQSGTGDAFMTPAFRACLIGSEEYIGPSGCKMSLWARFIELNATIFRYSKSIRGKDKWGSSWFLWIFNWRGALYYRSEVDAGTPDAKVGLIYVLMNPAMNILIVALTGLFFGVLFYNIRYRKTMTISDPFRSHLRRGAVLFFGWIGSMAPTMVVYRSGPLYQYLPGLFFAQALAACGFDLIPPRGRPLAATFSIALMTLAFLYWSPWVYGTPLSAAAHDARRWLPRWD